MGIDLYAFSEEYVKLCIAAPEDEPFETWKARREAHPQLGYVRESYHGVTHAVSAFCPETYGEPPHDPSVEILDDRYYYIPSAILESRMPEVEKLCRQRAQDYYDASNRGDPGYSHRDTEKERDDYAAYQIAAFHGIVDAVKDAESRGLKVYLLNSY